MQLNLGAIFLALLGVMATMAPSVLSEPHRHQGPIFDTRPSPFNPNQPRPRPGVYWEDGKFIPSDVVNTL